MLQVTIAWFAGFTFLKGLSAGFDWPGCRFAVTNYRFAVVGSQFADISLAVVGSSVLVVSRILRSRDVQPLNCQSPTANRQLQT
ncbi:MAG TPA: hypothetical protein VE641_17185 [Chthoniobacterales bacterium]|jgi:hypothetical protein|nr:hypothetical protein [Chthoniobacterales bacterium]